MSKYSPMVRLFVIGSSLALTACTQTAATVTAIVVGENLARMAVFGHYAEVGRNWDNKDQDFRELANSSDPVIAKFAKQTGPIELVPAENTLRPYDIGKLKAIREGLGNKQDGFLITSLALKSDVLAKQTVSNMPRSKVVLLKGLKNNSLSETMESVKVFTNMGATVLIYPELIQKVKANLVPTVSYVNVKSNGEYGCDDETKKCRLYSGFVGMYQPLIGKPLQFP